MSEALQRLKEQRRAARERLQDLLDRDDELPQADLDDFNRLIREIPEMDERIDDLREQERRAGLLQAATPVDRSEGVRVGREAATYRRDGQGHSYLRDRIAASLFGDQDARERLLRNACEVAGARQERALSAADGAGGEFVPPLWLVDEFAEVARAARVTADRCTRRALPAGTDSLNIPKVATGTAVAEQATQNTAVQNTDATTAAVTAAVATLAGQQVVSIQLIEQSPGNLDEILLADLAADYAVKLDTFVLNNNAASKRGLLNVAGINAITYTDASPTVAELYPKMADAIQRISTTRYLPPDAIVMHPRRWGWLAASLDSQNRPLVVPLTNVPINAVGVGPTAATNPEVGLVGTMHGLPVYVDANVPTTLGAGSNEDRILVARFGDAYLYESEPRLEVFREPLAAQLSALLRIYSYVAFSAERYPAAVSVISGSGMAGPSF